MEHFRNYNVLMDTKKNIRQSNTVDFFPTTCDNLAITPTKTLPLIIEDLLTVLKDPPPVLPFLPQSLGLTTAVEALQSILRPPTEEFAQEQRVSTGELIQEQRVKKNKTAPEIYCIDLSFTPKPSAPSIRRISIPTQTTNNNKQSTRSSIRIISIRHNHTLQI